MNFSMMTPGHDVPVPGSDPPGIALTAAQGAVPAVASPPARKPLIDPSVTAEQVRITELECLVQQLRADLLLLKAEYGKHAFNPTK